MRFKKGSKVELFNRRELPLRSWRCAEIISGNEHTSYVEYDHHPMDIGSAMERVLGRPLSHALLLWWSQAVGFSTTLLKYLTTHGSVRRCREHLDETTSLFDFRDRLWSLRSTHLISGCDNLRKTINVFGRLLRSIRRRELGIIKPPNSWDHINLKDILMLRGCMGFAGYCCSIFNVKKAFNGYNG